MTESEVQKRVRLRYSETGHVLFRNNVGKLQDPRGRWVTFGLHVGSSDLIGWRSVVITPEMVGRTIAQFVSVEVKAKRGQVRTEQAHWLATVAKAGGIAVVERGEM